MDSYLSQRPGSRYSFIQAGTEEVILEDTPLNLAPTEMAKAIQASIMEYNKYTSNLSREFRTQQTKIAKRKSKMSSEQRALLDSDIARLRDGDLPTSILPWVASDIAIRNEMLANHMTQFSTLAKVHGYETLLSDIESIQKAVESNKPLLPVPTPKEASDSQASAVALKARSNLEIFIQLAESRLNMIEKRLINQAGKRKSDESVSQALFKIGELRFESKFPEETAESDITYLKELAQKFEDSLKKLKVDSDPKDINGRKSLDDVWSEYRRRYGDLISSH